jgi:hypothetical protein
VLVLKTVLYAMARSTKFATILGISKRAIVARTRVKMTPLASQTKKFAAQLVWRFFWEELE